jgi:hypothetical protein
MDAAKCTRDSHNSATGLVKYTPEKRLEGSKVVKMNSDRDPIYAEGVRSALPFEFIFNGHNERFLEKIPIDSIIRVSLKEESKHKDVVTPDDLAPII